MVPEAHPPHLCLFSVFFFSLFYFNLLFCSAFRVFMFFVLFFLSLPTAWLNGLKHVNANFPSIRPAVSFLRRPTSIRPAPASHRPSPSPPPLDVAKRRNSRTSACPPSRSIVSVPSDHGLRHFCLSLRLCRRVKRWAATITPFIDACDF